MILYLIRHGESYSNIAGDFTGQLDSKLTEVGLKQAGSILSYFNGIHIDCIYASDLSRAYDTVLPISKVHRVPITPVKELREINGGKWQGVLFSEIAKQYPEAYGLWQQDIGNAYSPEGESIRDIYERVYKAVCEIAEKHSNETVVIATHALPIRSLLTRWTKGNIDSMKDVPWVPNASITKVEYKDGVFTPVEVGHTDHLEGLVTNNLAGKI